MRIALFLAAALLATPATAQDWPAKTERKPMTARAKQIAGPDYYMKGDDLDYAASELAACQPPPGKPDYCVDVVLNLARGYEDSERPLIEDAMDTVLTRYPVDPFPILAWRQPPAGDRGKGLDTLALAQDKSSTESRLACRNLRVRLALAIARWRMGGIAVPPARDQAISVCGPDSPEVPAAANAFAVIFATRTGATSETLKTASEAHADALRIFGADDRRTAITAANRGTLLFHSGNFSEAEPLLRAAFTRLDALSDRPAALAALVPLAELLLELNRGDEARVLLAGAAARDSAIGGPTLRVRVIAMRAKLEPDNAQALARFDEAIALARTAAAQKPDTALVDFQRRQIESMPAAFRDMDMFQRSIAMEQEELTRSAKALLAETIAAKAPRAFAAGQAAVARDTAREARTLDPTLHRAYLFEGLAALALGEGGNSEFLFGSAAIATIPPTHPDRMLIAMGMTYYHLGWSPTYAPCYARRGTAIALSRLSTDRGDSADNTTQFRGYSPLFRLQVMSSWMSAQSQQRSMLTDPRTCPERRS